MEIDRSWSLRASATARPRMLSPFLASSYHQPMTSPARRLPIIGALRGYNFAWLRADIVAGFRVCVVAPRRES